MGKSCRSPIFQTLSEQIQTYPDPWLEVLWSDSYVLIKHRLRSLIRLELIQIVFMQDLHDGHFA